MKRLCFLSARYSSTSRDPSATVKLKFNTGPPKTKRIAYLKTQRNEEVNFGKPPPVEVTDDLPPILHRPKDTLLTSLANFDQNSYQFVVFDLETTGLQANAEICQIATERIDLNKNHQHELWSTYILPNTAIDPGASLATGLVVKYAGNDRYLTHCGRRVETCSPRDGMILFYRYLKELSKIARHTILVGYCSKRFDVPVLCNSFGKFGIRGEELDELGICFADSESILKDIFSSIKSDQKRATLANIYESIFSEPFQAHNAINDVKALSGILFDSHYKPPPESLLSRATVAHSAFNTMEFLRAQSKSLNTMNGRLFSSVCKDSSRWPLTRYLARKTAASGLDYNEMKRIYQKWGKVGIDALCRTSVKSDTNRTSCRITYNTAVIAAICRHFEENC